MRDVRLFGSCVLIMLTACSGTSESADESLTETDTVAMDSAADPDADPDASPNDGETTEVVTGEVPVGEVCATSDDCGASGFCVPTFGSAPICTIPCTTSCPDGWRCIEATLEVTDPIFLCFPPDSDTTPIGGDTVGGDADASGGDSALADTTDESDTTTVIDGDLDGDGIPDDEDLIPCLGFDLIVLSDGVTAASVFVNAAEVVGPGAFPADAPIVVPLNPAPGVNTLALGGKLTGSPNDSLLFRVVDSTGFVWFEQLVVRGSGSPSEQSFTFTIDATCD